MTNNQKQYQDDEIDLRVLLTNLWGNKFLIFAITAIFSITGIAYALLAPQLWSAKAIVVAPLPEQLEHLQSRLNKLSTATDIANNKDSATNKDSVYFSAERLFTDFNLAFNSFDNKSEFLLSNGYAQQDPSKDGLALQRFLKESAKNISTTEMKGESGIILSFGDENAQEALERLKKYLDFIQTKERVNKNKLLTDIIANKTSALSLMYQVQEAETLKKHQENIMRTNYSLRISRAAGIEAPVESLNYKDVFPIDLGAKALSEKLNILKEIKNPVLINPALANIRLQLDSLQAVPQEQVNFTSYHFLQSPSEPLSRDKPKRTLVVIIAGLAGLMVGVIIALIRAGWSRKE